MRFLASDVRLATVAALATLSACSQPEPSSTGPIDPDTPFQSGQLSGSLIGALSPPTTTTGSGATVSGLVGRFTRLAFDPGGSSGDPLGSTPLFYSAAAAGQAYHVWRINLDGSGARQLTFDSLEFAPAVNLESGRVAFWREVEGSATQSFYLIISMVPDGTDQTVVAGPVACIEGRLEWAPSGNVLYNVGCDASLWETTVGKVFVFPTEGFSVVNSVAGQYALVGRRTLQAEFPGGIFKVNYPDRDTSTLLLGDTTDVFSQPEASRASPFRLAYWRRTAPDTIWKLHVGLLSAPTNTRVIRYASYVPFVDPPCLRWAPDGTKLIMNVTDNAGLPQLGLVDTLGSNVGQITHQEGRGVFGCPGVGKADSSGGSRRDPVVLIGEDGLFGATASGVIISQGAGASLASLVAFRARNQRSLQLETGTGLNSTAPALTYTLRADRLTALDWTSFPGADSAVHVLDSTATPVATGALITFDATNGAVALILPFSGTNLSQPVTVSDAGNSRTFQGTFLAAFDRRGQNLAPAGATEAVLDLKTGVVRVRR